MKKDLRDAVIVIMGASSGIGEATALAFARRGARLVLAARNASALQTVAKACREIGVDVLVHPTDVTEPQKVRELAEVAQSFGEIDAWISNAGVGAVGAFEETPIESHHRVIETNLVGHINDAHAVMPIFRRQRHGVFVNMISLSGFAAAPFAAAYSASKFGLKGFSEALRAEVADMPDIHVCDIYPAFIDTPGLSHGANYVGRELKAPPPVYDARSVADAIVRVVQQPKDTTTVGTFTDLVRVGHFLAPALTSKAMAWVMRRYFAKAERTRQSDGNLFRPSSRAGMIDGGLRPSVPPVVSLGMAATLFVVGMALGASSGSGREQPRERR